jgi:[ribosomal protein S5]-alanine N-acetyltransferase
MDFRADEIAPGFAFQEIESYSTDRIILRKVEPKDHLFLVKHKNESMVRRFLNINDQDAWITEKSKIEKGLSTWSFSFCNFYLFEKENGEPLGHCGFHSWNLRHQKAELGYMIYDSTNYGKRLMHEACDFVVNFGFKELKLVRIEAMTSPFNEASKRILRNLGFEEEGLLRKNYIKNKEPEDSIMFGLINSDIK